ncbi:MAG: acetate/propionate family kinase [Pirellulaceae bacterium]
MPVLIVNCGSTSIKASLMDATTGERITQLKSQRLGTDQASFAIDDGLEAACPSSLEDALKFCLDLFVKQIPNNQTVTSVGHRVVHGGREFTKPTLVTDEVLASLAEITALAPLHHPANLTGIRVARKLLGDVPHVAVFDTAFHATLPRRAYSYALPADVAKQHGLRRYGFHGTSHQYVASLAADYLKTDIRQLRLITCHLGGGCSVCAVEYGRSVETSMGMTPLEGLVMGTRSGDVDPGLLLHLSRANELSIDELDVLLNRQSGLFGLSGSSSDMRDIESKAEAGDEGCRLALNVFCHRLRKYVGAYAAVMGGVDAIVFTAGIGQNSAVVRHRTAQRMEYLGACLDEDLNRDATVSHEKPIAEISSSHTRVRLLVAQTDEGIAIAQQAELVRQQISATASQRTIPVAISARHIHLTQETVEALFGEGHTLTPMKPLSQPGQFAAEEQVTLVGPKRSIQGVRVLGPVRGKDQVEVSRTDEFYLGIDAPIRASGDVKNTPGITLIGSDNRHVTLQNGVICAWRHIHMTPDDAKAFGVKDRDVVDVEVGDRGVRSLTFGDVLVRVKSSCKLEMHIDTDEGNAAELDRVDVGVLDDDTFQPVSISAHLA